MSTSYQTQPSSLVTTTYLPPIYKEFLDPIHVFFIFILLFLYIFLGFVRTLLAVFNLFLVFLSWVKIFLHFLTPSDFLKLFFLLFLTFWNRFWTILNPLGLGFFVIDPFLLIIACLSPGYQFLTLFHFSFTFLAFFDRFKFFWPLFKVLFI